jgi:hypothetical protein
MPEGLTAIAVTTEQINNCQYSTWYKKYRKVSPKARIIKPLPKEFIEYLLADGIVLPEEEIKWKGREVDNEKIREIGDSGIEEVEASEEETVGDPTTRFPDLHTQIKSIIDELGAVCPKLNWSAPKDSIWIATSNTMRCVSPSDIYMLLKASNYITHDLTEPYPDGKLAESYELVLRSWFDINPSLEFRCFVKDSKLVAISQRDMNYYDFLEPLKSKLLTRIEAFFNENLKETFPDPSYVFDVYVPRPFDRVWLIDINPFADYTDSLLFSWDQLAYIKSTSSIDFRLVDKLDSSRGFGTVEHTENYVPMDFVEAGMMGQSITELTQQWKKLLQSQEEDDDSEDEE